ncbi:MAG: NUDIX hydrolase [bacterium]|nr:NUDIX hydrolase [bacterium]
MNPILSAKTIVFRQDGKFLALHRTETAPHNPLTWDFPGGIIDEGETLETGAIREIKEETGIEVEDLKLLDLESKIIESGELYIFTIYTAQAKSENIVLSYEHDKFQWVTLEEFMSLNAPLKLKNAAKKSAG